MSPRRTTCTSYVEPRPHAASREDRVPAARHARRVLGPGRVAVDERVEGAPGSLVGQLTTRGGGGFVFSAVIPTQLIKNSAKS